MIKAGYDKTIVIWTDNETDKVTFSKIIKGIKFHPVICETEAEVLKIRSFLIFARDHIVPPRFVDHERIRKNLKDGELKIMHIEDTGFKPLRMRSYFVDSALPEDVISKIKHQAKIAEKFNCRRIAMKNKLTRLFYIYTQFESKGEVHMSDVIDKTGISKKTFYRDLEIIRDICVDTMSIENPSNTTTYVKMKPDFIKKYAKISQ